MDKFFQWVKGRWSVRPHPNDKFIAALGLVGEAGEVTEIIKKANRGWDPRPMDRAALILEMGDVLHYWCVLCYQYDLDPQQIMEANCSKLLAREAKAALKGSV